MASCQNDRLHIGIASDYSSVWLQGFNASPLDELKEQFQVYVLDGVDDSIKRGQASVLGSYELSGRKLTFKPSYPFLKGKSYLARYKVGEGFLDKRFSIPRPEKENLTEILNVYPTARVLPINILKFYIEFSQPMSEGFAYDHITILKTENDTVKDVFLRLEEELWSADMKRLTLLLDPGRIKQGLQSFDALGYAFEEGETYKLQIRKEWPDADGFMLKDLFTKTFEIGEAYISRAGNFEIAALPESGTKDTLRLNFDRPHDYALLLRTIRVLSGDGVNIKGRIEVQNNERTWTFSPDQNWKPGKYQIEIQTILEDLAGNNLLNAFDIDNRSSETDFGKQKSRIVTFDIR